MDNMKRGEHRNKTLSSGLEVHLLRYPGSGKWRFYSFDVTWGADRGMTTKTWFAERMGIEKEFDDPDAAYRFAERHVKLTPPIPATCPP